MAALLVGRVLMETGARAEVVHEGCSLVARGLGAGHVDLRSGYASLDITVGEGTNTATRMLEVGPHGINYRLNRGIRDLVRRIQPDGLSTAEVLAEVSRLQQETRHHAPWLVALAAGVACAAFGRLLGIDWTAFLPVLAAAAAGQAFRQALLRRGVNIFVVATAVAFLSSSASGLWSKWAGSGTVPLAMIASVLLLVPGLPALNAQSDVMEGHPTLGNARATSVAILLMFIAIGVLIARAIVEARP